MNNIENHVMQLNSQILKGAVVVGTYRYFTIYEPKERKICASAFGEQVLHHALMNICHDDFERKQIYDSYASRKGKGVHAALERAKQNTSTRRWYLKLDVRKFFESVHHETLIEQLTHLFKDAGVVGIFEQIICSYGASTGRGVPIGNLTSQYFANHYLSGLDHFIKEELRIKRYTRYMDDMVLWSNDKKELLACWKSIEAFVNEKLHCELKAGGLNQSKYGLPFLGYHIFPYHTRLLRQSKQRFIEKIGHVNRRYINGDWLDSKCQRHALPLCAFIAHADAQKFQKAVFLRIEGQLS